MKSTIKKIFITYLVIICCIYTPTAQAANWSFSGFNFGSNSLNIVKDGVKITTAAVDTAPITSSLAARIASGALRGASLVGAITMIADLGGAAVDWVLDPANNRIKYIVPPDKNFYYQDSYSGKNANTPDLACKNAAAYFGVTVYKLTLSGGDYICKFTNTSGQQVTAAINKYEYPTNERTIPLSDVAQKIYTNAKSGDADAQSDVLSAIADLVNQGVYDVPINKAIQDAIDNGTLPKDTDTTTDPTNPQIDTSSIIAAIQSLASAFASAISNAFNGITSVINTSIDKILNKQDQMQGELVNIGTKIDAVGGKVVGVGDKVDAVGGKVVGLQDAVKDVGGKVVGLNDSVDKVGDAVVGVGDKVDAAGDKVGTKVDAVGDKVADAVKDSTKEITDKMEQTKPKDFELPAFCSWASKVCDFIDWVKVEPDVQDTPVPTDNTPLKNPSEFDKDYVSVVAQCPPDVVREIPLPGQSFNLVFGMSPVCDFASTYLRPVIIFLAYIYGALSIGNAFKVGG